MSVSVTQILESPQFQRAIDRLRAGYTQQVMSKGVKDDARQTALTKFHLLDELLVDLSQHKQE